MNQTEFWQLVDATHQASGGDAAVQEARLIEELAQHSPDDIVDFERLLRQYIIAADDFGVMAAQKIIQGWVSDDPYLYLLSLAYQPGRASIF